MKNRPRAEYEPMPEPVPEKPRAKKERSAPRECAQELPVPEIFAVPEPANASAQPQEGSSGGIFSRRRKKAAIDIPIEDEPLPEEPIPDMPQGILYQGQPDMAAVADCIRRGEEKRAKNRRSAEENPFIENAAPAEEEPFIENAVSAEEEPFIEETAPAEDLSLEDGSAEIGIESVREPVPFVKPEKLRREDVDAAADEIAQTIEETEQMPEYQYPPVTLLKAGDGITSDGREEVSLNRERLETTLHSFGIGASVTEITRGPTVTRYDLELEAGVKLSKLTNLAGDLALSLGVVSVRIAPIPDKISTVGVEVPNKVVSTVYLRDIIDSPAFQNAASKPSFAIGKDIGGNCIVGNIAKLPHMRITGSTGSGKSVCMNSLILSLLYKATPDEVRLIMIDPKMVELGIYNGIPHLYIPVDRPEKSGGLAAVGSRGNDEALPPLLGDWRARSQGLQYLQDPPRRADDTERCYRDRRAGRSYDDRRQRGGREHLPHRPDGPCCRYAPHYCHAAPVRRRHHRPYEGQHPEPHRVCRFECA